MARQLSSPQRLRRDVECTPSLYISLVKQIAQSIIDFGFGRLFFLNGHGGNRAPAAAALAELAAEMESVVLEDKNCIQINDIDINESIRSRDVRIKSQTVDICGSDIHYDTHGPIWPFIVRKPTVLGHEAAGTVIEIGSEVTELAEVDRICMEPGIPDPDSSVSRLGMYNLSIPRATSKHHKKSDRCEGSSPW